MVEQVELALAVIGCDVLRDAVKTLQKGIGNPVSAGAGRFQCGCTAWVCDVHALRTFGGNDCPESHRPRTF